MATAISQRGKNACGMPIKLKVGGSVPFLKSGKKDSPLETAKRNNGIPGYKSGGKVKKKC